jgi:SAM-dependent methyltransferase
MQAAKEATAAHWNASHHGSRLAAMARAEVGLQLPELFGRHFLQIGTWDAEHDWLAHSEMLHRAVIAIGPSGTAQARVDPAALPFPARSVDAVLLPHTLETVPSPHTLLREVARVLSDRGRLLMVGFNPWSLLGLRRRLGLAPRALPSQAHFYSAGRVTDWLTLLDFEISAVRRFGVGFPWTTARSEGQPLSPAALLSPFAEAYLIHARKRVTPVNWVGRSERAQVRTLVAMPVANRLRHDPAPEQPQP